MHKNNLEKSLNSSSPFRQKALKFFHAPGQVLIQTHSQGLSSFQPLGQAWRDPGWVWSHVSESG